ncbi:MAG TPA: hypothetical protein VHQ93_15830 [Chitinophagaceae bacterium]|nr:hypothetical protein [Chitinophagaceae bacterium]
MPDYRIRPGGYEEIRKQSLKKLLVFISFIAVIVIVTTAYNAKADEYAIITIPATIIIFTIVFAFSIRNVFKKQKKLLDSYALTINDNTITRYQLNTPTITLYRTEIKEILRKNNKGFIVRGMNAEDTIYVPSQVEKYHELEILLNEIKPIISYRPKNVFEKFPIVTIILVFGLMVGVYASMNKVVVVLCGIPVIIIIAWSFFKIQKNKNIERKAKRSSWVILVILLSIIYITVAKLTGTYNP